MNFFANMHRRPRMPIPFALLAAMREERKRARAEARATARLMRIVARREREAVNDLSSNLEILNAFINGE